MRHSRVIIAGVGLAAVAAAGGITVASAGSPPAGTARPSRRRPRLLTRFGTPATTLRTTAIITTETPPRPAAQGSRDARPRGAQEAAQKEDG
jgi:hypothetical protein